LKKEKQLSGIKTVGSSSPFSCGQRGDPLGQIVDRGHHGVERTASLLLQRGGGYISSAEIFEAARWQGSGFLRVVVNQRTLTGHERGDGFFSSLEGERSSGGKNRGDGGNVRRRCARGTRVGFEKLDTRFPSACSRKKKMHKKGNTADDGIKSRERSISEGGLREEGGSSLRVLGTEARLPVVENYLQQPLRKKSH